MTASMKKIRTESYKKKKETFPPNRSAGHNKKVERKGKKLKKRKEKKVILRKGLTRRQNLPRGGPGREY